MRDVLKEIQEEAQDIYDALGTETGEDATALKKVAQQLMGLLSRPELAREARKRTELALAVTEFAEWQNVGYMEDVDTYQLISRTLWDRVSENVQDVIQRAPKTPRFSQSRGKQSFN